MSTQICKSCGAEIPQNAQFCPNCGKKITARVCEACGAEIIEGARFCRNCGKEIGVRLCQNCGTKVPDGARFCTNCGKEAALPLHPEKRAQDTLVLQKEMAQAQPPAGVVPKREARFFKIRTPFWPLFLKVILPILIIIVAGIGVLRPELFIKFLPEVKLLSVESSDPLSVSMHYAWKPVGGLTRYSWDIAIPRELYQYYENKPRVYFHTEEYETNPYLIYITDPEDDYLLKAMVASIDNLVAKKGLSEEERLYISVAFAQSILYKLDIESTGCEEYPRYPVETLVDEVGDCEDHAILLGALFREMGYDVALILFPETSAHKPHVGLGVAEGRGLTFDGIFFSKDGRKYYYLETAGGSFFKIGVPTEFTDASPYVLPVVP